MAQAPMMGNPYEYRELMKAQFRFGETRTVDQVLEDHRRRHEEAANAAKNRSKKGRTFMPTQAPAGTDEIKKTDMDAVLALLGGAKPKSE